MEKDVKSTAGALNTQQMNEEGKRADTHSFTHTHRVKDWSSQSKEDGERRVALKGNRALTYFTVERPWVTPDPPIPKSAWVCVCETEGEKSPSTLRLIKQCVILSSIVLPPPTCYWDGGFMHIQDWGPTCLSSSKMKCLSGGLSLEGGSYFSSLCCYEWSFSSNPESIVKQ